MLTLAISGLGFRYHLFRDGESLEVRPVDIPIPGWPKGLDGLRIAQWTDLHYGPYSQDSDLRRAVALTQEGKPDLIVMTGDLISVSGKYLAGLPGILGGLTAPLGKFACLGNHDFHFGPVEEKIRCLEDSGFTVLRNRGLVIEYRGERFGLAGVDDYWKGVPDVEAALREIPDDVPTVLLAHIPDFAESLEHHGPVLVISGHTHGGQICVGREMALYTASDFGGKFRSGLIETGRTKVYISRGVGVANVPFRRKCPPEIPILVLRSCS
jgi:predicted MPP superfamily phosphohydrolase